MPKSVVWEKRYEGFRTALGDAPEVHRAVAFLEKLVRKHPFCAHRVPGDRRLLRIARCGGDVGWFAPLRLYYSVGRREVYLWRIEPYDPAEILGVVPTYGSG